MSVRKPAITVEELLLFNDELRALARAGVPLERGLSAIGNDLPGRLGPWVQAIGLRVERGESLAGVLDDPALSLPPVYAAVVAAGIRAGRLPAALESLSQSLVRAIDFRRNMLVALIYPILLLLLASAVFVFTWLQVFPRLHVSISALLDDQLPFWFGWLYLSVAHGSKWLLATWFCVVSGALWWFVRSRRAAALGTRSRWPSVRSVNAAGRIATFAETLAILIEQHVPLAESLRLAGGASGDRKVAAAAETLAQRIHTGQCGGPGPGGLPPLMSWLILSNGTSAHLVRTLRQTAASQREYAARASLTLGIYVPIFCAAIVGGFVAVYYSVLVMLPFFYLLKELGKP